MSYPGEWMNDGLCAQVDPALWFPEVGGSTREAKMVCRKCPVLGMCAAYALRSGESLTGVWGAMSERERREIRAGRLAP